ncbi:uncharacterized protein [Phyllobates terribilis]|uniref:uncharacterized protein n=1 Tax=Phyllobates terribilis TaxID=111132 RepID=UPI003CCA8A55
MDVEFANETVTPTHREMVDKVAAELKNSNPPNTMDYLQIDPQSIQSRAFIPSVDAEEFGYPPPTSTPDPPATRQRSTAVSDQPPPHIAAAVTAGWCFSKILAGDSILDSNFTFSSAEETENRRRHTSSEDSYSRELYRIMEFVRNMERRRLIKPQDILATLQSIPEDESESELQEHVFDSDSDEDFIPQNISSESEDSEGTNPEDIPSTSTGDRAHAVMLPRDHPPGRGQKKSAKRPRNERTTDNDGGEGNATTNTREGESEGILVSADGIQWKPVEIGEHLPGRRDSQNILREAPGPTGYARRNIIIDSPLSAWRLFFDSYILTHIKNCTLAEACRNNNLQFTLSDEELDAFIAIFYARGISGTNRHSISSIWCNDWGIPFCKATMSRDRFVEIMRFLRFDEKSTRSERLQTDKFALFSTVWDRFIENCIACYKPGPYITVDEQLFPSKTRCPFTQYMPSKPDKYGHKYWLAVDKRSKYLANGFPYLGKDDTRRAEDRLADHVVMKLLDPFLKKGRNVTTDNYFTKVKLAKQLKSKGTTIVGTLNKIRREVPKEIKSMKEELYNTSVEPPP